MKNLFAVKNQSLSVDVVLLLIRIAMGIAFILHGQGKIQNPFSWMGDSVPGILQALAALAEFGGGIILILGLFTNLAAFGLLCTMVVATIFHGVIQGDPFVSKGGGASYELAMIYLLISLLLLITGPGRFSIDRKLFGLRSL